MRERTNANYEQRKHNRQAIKNQIANYSPYTLGFSIKG